MTNEKLDEIILIILEKFDNIYLCLKGEKKLKVHKAISIRQPNNKKEIFIEKLS